MLSLLVYLYETEILTGKFKEPDCVMDESNIYKSNNDSFAKFMQERLIKDVGAQTKEKDILKEYKTWLSQEPDMKALTPIDVRRKMIEKYGKPILDKKDGKEAYRGAKPLRDPFQRHRPPVYGRSAGDYFPRRRMKPTSTLAGVIDLLAIESVP